MSADSKDRGAPPLTQTPGPAGADPITHSKLEPSDHAADLPSWGGLERLELIGSGGFGRVFKAWDPTLARAVALKLIHIPEPDAASSVLREGQLLARLRHRNIVTVFGAQQKDDEIGILMELVRGRSLADIVEQDGPLGSDEASIIGVSLCQALAAVHAAGLVHRDVKARNVMREAGGRIVLMDFGAGLDRREMREPTGSHMLTGTPLCMAPEVLLGQPATPVSDIYSLGVLLFYLTTGKHPVEGKNLREIVIAHSSGQRTPLTDLRPDVPTRFVQVVDRALAADVDDRYASAGKMMRELLDILPAGATSSVPADEVAAISGRGSGASESGHRSRPLVDRVSSSATATVAAPSLWPRDCCRGRLCPSLSSSVSGRSGFCRRSRSITSLARTSDFSKETPVDWFVWGVRALIAPAVYMVVVTVPLMFLSTWWHVFARFSSRAQAFEARLRQWVKVFHLDDPVLMGQVLFTLEVMALLLVVIRFGDLILSAATFVADADPEIWLGSRQTMSTSKSCMGASLTCSFLP